MNAERLKQTIDFVLKKEKEHRIQNTLEALLQALQELVQQPQQAQAQTKTATALDALEKAITTFFDPLTPAQIENIKEIGAYQYFSPALPLELRGLFTKNGMTPAVVQQHVKETQEKRKTYVDVLRNLSTNLAAVGVGAIPLTPGEPEMGVRLPERLFKNEFGELVKTLSSLNLIFRFFSEAVSGSAMPITVRQISTTDPIFFLGIDATTAVEIGLTVTWLLNTLKQLLEIKKLRNETQRVGFSESDLKIFDDRIQQTINQSIDERVNQILQKYNRENIRENLDQGLKWASRMLMAWIERGLTIEVRALRPPASGDEKKDAANNELFAQIETISQQLSFPPMEGPAVLQLPNEPPASVDGIRS